MISSRYVVFNNAPQRQMVAFNANELADALRAPLAAIGVRVVRQPRTCANSFIAGFQARGWPRKKYQDKLKAVDAIVGKYILAGQGMLIRDPSKPE
jgi:hypothetical protein